MTCPAALSISTALPLLVLIAGSALGQGDQDDGDVSIVSCLESCEACATGLSAGDAVLDSEFASCNTCGGVAWSIECAVRVQPAPGVEVKVKAHVEAGAVEAILGPYGVMADCNRNLLLVESRTHEDVPTGVWDVIEVVGIEGEEGMLQATLPPEGDGAESPIGPLTPGVVPSANETIACSAELD